MRSRPHVLARRKARATAQGDASAGGSVTSSRRRSASSYLTTSGCGTTSAGRCLTAERAGRQYHPQPIERTPRAAIPARGRPAGTPCRRRAGRTRDPRCLAEPPSEMPGRQLRTIQPSPTTRRPAHRLVAVRQAGQARPLTPERLGGGARAPPEGRQPPTLLPSSEGSEHTLDPTLRTADPRRECGLRSALRLLLALSDLRVGRLRVVPAGVGLAAHDSYVATALRGAGRIADLVGERH